MDPTRLNSEVIEDDENNKPVQETNPQDSPPLVIEDLAQAWEYSNKVKQEANNTTEPAAEDDDTNNERGEQDPPQVPAGSGDPSNEPATDPSDTSVGGSATPVEMDYDYDPQEAVASYKAEIDRAIAPQILKKMEEDGWAKLTVNDLKKVGQDGSVEFINPDTKRPFTGNNPRSEAQNWLQAYNSEANNEFIQRLNKARPYVYEQYKPALQLREFIPVYEQMDPVRKEIWEGLLDGHELTDRQGNIMGYDCDLNATYNLMEKQIKILLAKQASMKAEQDPADNIAQQDPVTKPATALKTTTGSKKQEKVEIKNLSDAWEFKNKQKFKKEK